VKLAASTCPFCAAELIPVRAQHARPVAFTRAAIFSAAALAACSDHKVPAPAPGSAHVGSSDDLENLLDDQPKHADHPAPADAEIDAAAQVAVAVDAGLAPDAGVDPQVAAEKRRQLQRKQIESEIRRQQELMRQKQHIMNKPYGAPPARRRVV